MFLSSFTCISVHSCIVILVQEPGDEEDGDEEPPVTKELRLYASLPALETPGKQPDMNQNPLLWWKGRATKFPILSSLARKYLSVHAASAAVERMFSYTGNRVGKKEWGLGDDTLLSLMLVRSYAKFCETYGPRYLPQIQNLL